MPEYPGSLERKRCEERIRAELAEYPPARPLSLKEEIRIRGMYGRCSACRGCAVVNQLIAWLPPVAVAVAEVLKLAG